MARVPLELPAGVTLVLYDGVCGLCNWLVRFILLRDRADRYRFSSLQGEVGRALVRERGGDPDVLSTLYVIERLGAPDERVWRRGRAALIALGGLGRGWVLLHLLRALPTFVLDLGYRAIAGLRYRLGGRLESCPVPAPEHRDKFVGT